MYKVAVLLSAYNGEKYIEEQIESIYNQEDVEVTLFVRNDGSSDSTMKILKKYERAIVFNEPNIGLARSFMKLIQYAGQGFDYYCFADQDDVWLKDKIIAGCKAIENSDKPCLYSSNQTLVDKQKNVIKTRYEGSVDVSYKQILCNNLISGCTMIWNKSLQKLLSEKMPSNELLDKRIHDVWVGMVAASVGELIFDKESHILYRQHEANVVGVKKRSKLKAQLKKLFNKSKRNGRSCLAREILERFGDNLDQEKREFLEMCANYKKSLKMRNALLKDNEIYVKTGESRRSYMMKVIFNLF